MLRNTSVTRGGEPKPCGRCENCLKRRISNWSFRLMQEAKVSKSAYFITLTYDTSCIRFSKNGFMELRKDDLQRWFKRIRFADSGRGKSSIRYYAVGEYGGRFRRPHYHVILFNAGLQYIIGTKLSSYVDRGIIKLDGTRPFISDTWKYGHITVGEVTPASVGYTMKYVSKPWHPMHKNDDRQPVFPLMSKGLGLSYLTKAMVAWYHADMYNRQYCQIEDGKKISLPRYYRKKLFTMQEIQDQSGVNKLELLREVEFDGKARIRSESYYQGLDRVNYNHSQNQKL